jgi:hypothetical protein
MSIEGFAGGHEGKFQNLEVGGCISASLESL